MQFLSKSMATACGMAALTALSACSGPNDVVQVTERRVTAPAAETVNAASSNTLERMGYRNQPSAELPPGHPLLDGELPPGHPPIDGIEAHMHGMQATPASFQWQAPDGWVQAAPRPMREATFQLSEDSEAECYVTALTAAGGGIGPNINRWRAQMGQRALTDAEIAQLPTVEVLGQAASLVEIRGDYTGMTGGTHPDYLLLGVVAALPERTVFVKMTGPEEELERERDNFVAFSQSLEVVDAHVHTHGAGAEEPCCPNH